MSGKTERWSVSRCSSSTFQLPFRRRGFVKSTAKSSAKSAMRILFPVPVSGEPVRDGRWEMRDHTGRPFSIFLDEIMRFVGGWMVTFYPTHYTAATRRAGSEWRAIVLGEKRKAALGISNAMANGQLSPPFHCIVLLDNPHEEHWKKSQLTRGHVSKRRIEGVSLPLIQLPQQPNEFACGLLGPRRPTVSPSVPTFWRISPRISFFSREVLLFERKWRPDESWQHILYRRVVGEVYNFSMAEALEFESYCWRIW